jgi:hypothetical protein
MDLILKTIWKYLGSAQNVKTDSLLFRKKRAEGIHLLFELKSNFQSIEEMKSDFYTVKNSIYKTHQVTLIQEDLLDEMEAILIDYYPMPDFWTSNIEDFKQHKSFSEDFETLHSE